MPTFLRASLLAPLLAVPCVQAQEADLAERLFRSGERAYATKAYAEALETWSQLLAQAPKSPQAPVVLVRMARHKLDVEKQPEAAIALLDKVKADYLQTPPAREAMLLKGQILFQRAKRPQDLRDILGEFNRLIDLFPDAPEVPEAYYHLGQAQLAQGQPIRALAAFAEAAQRDPAHPITARALLATAETLDQIGDLEGCLTILQRILTTHPGSPEAAEAPWRMAVRVRHRLQRPALKSQGAWPAGRPPRWLKTPTLLAQNQAGELFVFQDGTDQVSRITASGLENVGGPTKNAKALAVGPEGLPWPVVPKTGALRPDGTQVALPALAQPSGAFLDRWGTLWAGDARNPSLTLTAQDGSTRSLPSPVATALAPLPDGGAVLASDANRSLLFLTASGQTRVQVPYGKDLPAAFKTVMALATDPLGHVAALVEGGDFEGVVVWGPDGTLLRQATYKALGLSGRFRAVVLDRQGGLILADRTNDLLIRVE